MEEALSHFSKRLNEISIYEWTNENLFLDRAWRLRRLKEKLLFFAIQKKLNKRAPLMQFLKKIADPNFDCRNIDIRNKEELKQFIEILEPSVESLDKEGYYEQYNIKRDGHIFNFIKLGMINYIERLKEIAENWDIEMPKSWPNTIAKDIAKCKKRPLTTKQKSKLILKCLLYLALTIILIGALVLFYRNNYK